MVNINAIALLDSQKLPITATLFFFKLMNTCKQTNYVNNDTGVCMVEACFLLSHFSMYFIPVIAILYLGDDVMIWRIFTLQALGAAGGQ